MSQTHTPLQQSDPPIRLPQLTAVTLSARTSRDALLIADACFPDRQDQRHIRWAYSKIARNDLRFYEAVLKGDATFLHHDVHYRDGLPLGISGRFCLLDAPSEHWLGWLGVHPDFQGHGYGSRIVLNTLEQAKTEGAEKIAVYTEDRATNHLVHTFYERLGFSMTRRVNFEGARFRLYAKPT